MNAPTPHDANKDFTGAMLNIYRDALKETGTKHSYFLNMVNELGGHETAIRLIYTSRPSDGYTDLHLHGCLHLAVEAVVLQKKWDSIFTAEDRLRARKRLTEYNFDFAKHGLEA